VPSQQLQSQTQTHNNNDDDDNNNNNNNNNNNILQGRILLASSVSVS
jgi:hypothetical protein